MFKVKVYDWIIREIPPSEEEEKEKFYAEEETKDFNSALVLAGAGMSMCHDKRMTASECGDKVQATILNKKTGKVVCVASLTYDGKAEVSMIPDTADGIAEEDIDEEVMDNEKVEELEEEIEDIISNFITTLTDELDEMREQVARKISESY